MSAFGAARASVSDSRLILCRAATKARQFAIVVSIGARARPIMIEAAIIAPAVSSCLITRYAPRPRIIDCSKSLNTFEVLPYKPATSLRPATAAI